MEVIELLQPGDVIELNDSHCVEAFVPKHFVYENKKGHFDSCWGTVNLSGELSYLKGLYIVTSVELTGGSESDGYEDGHLVHCVKSDSDTTEIKFFQTGSFMTKIDSIKPIGKATLKWVFDDRLELV